MVPMNWRILNILRRGYEEYLSEGSSHYYSESVSENAEEGDGGYADFILDQPGLTEADGGEDWAPSGVSLINICGKFMAVYNGINSMNLHTVTVQLLWFRLWHAKPINGNGDVSRL